jgi:hypothetical protein
VRGRVERADRLGPVFYFLSENMSLCSYLSMLFLQPKSDNNENILSIPSSSISSRFVSEFGSDDSKCFVRIP